MVVGNRDCTFELIETELATSKNMPTKLPPHLLRSLVLNCLFLGFLLFCFCIFGRLECLSLIFVQMLAWIVLVACQSCRQFQPYLLCKLLQSILVKRSCLRLRLLRINQRTRSIREITVNSNDSFATCVPYAYC